MKNLTTDEFCETYNVGKTKFYQELNSGRLKAVKLGKKTLIPESAAEEWQAKLTAYPVKNKQEA